MKILYLVISLFLVGCTHRNPSAEMKDEDMLIQIKTKEQSPDRVKIFQVRIFPDFKKTEIQAQQKMRKNMEYDMDSCFYRSLGGIKQYPDEVIQVPNGIKDCYEYMLLFSDRYVVASTKSVITYRDKNINGKSYSLILR